MFCVVCTKFIDNDDNTDNKYCDYGLDNFEDDDTHDVDIYHNNDDCDDYDDDYNKNYDNIGDYDNVDS